jgi:hypothetical protein
MAVSRERGIAVQPGYDQEAGRISRQMLRFALGAHLGTALAAAVIAITTGNKAGYYIAGIALLSTAFRPAAPYFGHLRERIKVLTRESTHPRDDVATLPDRADTLEQSVGELRLHQENTSEDLRRTESVLTDAIAHAQQVLAADLNRLQDMQAADRVAGRSRDDGYGSSGRAGSSWAAAAATASVRATPARLLYTGLFASVSRTRAMATPRAGTGSGAASRFIRSRMAGSAATTRSAQIGTAAEGDPERRAHCARRATRSTCSQLPAMDRRLRSETMSRARAASRRDDSGGCPAASDASSEAPKTRASAPSPSRRDGRANGSPSAKVLSMSLTLHLSDARRQWQN